MRATEGNFHKYSWKIHANESDDGDVLEKFSKEAATYSIVLNFRGELNSRKQIMDKLTEDFEHDVRTLEAGIFVFGEYYIKGYVVESDTQTSVRNNNWTQKEIKIYCPKASWIKETHFSFLPDPVRAHPVCTYRSSSIKAVLPEFKFDFVNKHKNGNWTLNNPSTMESNFIMTIYGFCTNPKIMINGHPYTVETTAYEGERIVINSMRKGEEDSVIKIGRLGEITNLYNARGKEYSVFKKIPPGISQISWPGTYGVDITTFEERSEPKWSL